MKLVELEAFANAEAVFINPTEIESLSLNTSSYRDTVNQPYYILTMRSGDTHEITVEAGKILLKRLKKN